MIASVNTFLADFMPDLKYIIGLISNFRIMNVHYFQNYMLKCYPLFIVNS